MSHTNHRRSNPPPKRRKALKGRGRRDSLSMSTEARRDAIGRSKGKRRVHRTLRRRHRRALDVDIRTKRTTKPRTGKSSWRWPSDLRRPH